jgi:hypothetical protein
MTLCVHCRDFTVTEMAVTGQAKTTHLTNGLHTVLLSLKQQLSLLLLVLLLLLAVMVLLLLKGKRL